MEWRVSVQDILAIEKMYPGLWEDLAIEGWQRKLIKEVMTDGKPGRSADDIQLDQVRQNLNAYDG